MDSSIAVAKIWNFIVFKVFVSLSISSLVAVLEGLYFVYYIVLLIGDGKGG